MTEAVFLADRVLVLSPRPAHVIAEIDITLPRPRQTEMLEAPEFTSMAREIARALARAGDNPPREITAQ